MLVDWAKIHSSGKVSFDPVTTVYLHSLANVIRIQIE
jgi:hypothetical protein